MVVRSLDLLEKHTGQRPIGWLSPGFGELFNTPDVLAGAGIKYIAEWPYNDEPTRISTKHGPLVTLPYPIETQDVTTLAVQTQEAPYFTEVHRCVRASVRGEREAAEVLRHRHPSVRRRPAARHQVSRGDLRARRQVQGRADLERQGNLRLVFRRPEKFVGPITKQAAYARPPHSSCSSCRSPFASSLSTRRSSSRRRVTNAARREDEPGCLRFDVIRDRDDPNCLNFYEVYQDDAALAVHRQTPHFKVYLEKTQSWLAAPAERRFGTII